jgi:hypothetical protein
LIARCVSPAGTGLLARPLLDQFDSKLKPLMKG